MMTIKEKEKIVLQAIKNGFYFKNVWSRGKISFQKTQSLFENKKLKEDRIICNLSYEQLYMDEEEKEDYIIRMYQSGVHGILYLDNFTFYDYGSKWALTKEELE